MKSRNYRKQPYWALRKYFRKYYVRVEFKMLITGNSVTCTIYGNYINLQYYMSYKHGLFQVCNYKYHA